MNPLEASAACLPPGGAADSNARVGVSRPHESAHLHVAGAAPYIDDLPELAGTLHAALGLSPVAHGTLLAIDLARLQALPGVVAVRRANFYARHSNKVTPYEQLLDDNIIEPLVAQLATQCDYAARRAAVAAYNAGSTVLQRGLALTPVKFGISFNLAHLNQAGALVQVYADGSILVNHGGTEMGQGLRQR